MTLCGHATLAASKVLFDTFNYRYITFKSFANQYNVEIKQDESISMKFPLDDYAPLEKQEIYNDFFENIEIEECFYGTKTKKVVLVIKENCNIKLIKPKYEYMFQNKGIYSNGIGITKKSTSADFETRYFNPWAGVNEDPVTGSVHTLLAKYWGDMLGKSHLIAKQVSYRPGIINLEIDSNFVHISGKAKIVFQGKLTI